MQAHFHLFVLTQDGNIVGDAKADTLRDVWDTAAGLAHQFSDVGVSDVTLKVRQCWRDHTETDSGSGNVIQFPTRNAEN